MATTYFGHCDSSGNPGSAEGNDAANSNLITGCNTLTYTCPGSGEQDILDLAVRAYGSSGSIRVAVYSSAGSLMAQHTNPVNVGGSVAWVGAGAAITKVANLTGGATYKLEVQPSSDSVYWAFTENSGNGNTSYSYGAFPSTLPSMDGYIRHPIMRCGVDTAAGGASIPRSNPFSRPFQQSLGRGGF